jgi:hypothetical protein
MNKSQNSSPPVSKLWESRAMEVHFPDTVKTESLTLGAIGRLGQSPEGFHYRVDRYEQYEWPPGSMVKHDGEWSAALRTKTEASRAMKSEMVTHHKRWARNAGEATGCGTQSYRAVHEATTDGYRYSPRKESRQESIAARKYGVRACGEIGQLPPPSRSRR